MPNVWIVTVNYNGLADTAKCLQSLIELTTEVHIVVVDNASEVDPIPTLQAEFPQVHYLGNSVNRGWSGGNNSGIRYALNRGANFILLLNNDTIVSPRLIARLLTAAENYPQSGIIGPVIRYMDEPGEVMTDGVVFNGPGGIGFFQRRVVPEQYQAEPMVAEVDIVNGCCMMISSEVFARIGLIDDRFFLIHEEADFCLRAREAGFGCGVLAEGLVWHKGSTAFKRSGKRWQRYYDTRNLGLLLSKHRSGLKSYIRYLLYAYHRYCHEREDAQPDAAQAVLEGFSDFLTRKFGVWQARGRWLVPILRWVFELGRWAKPSHRGEMPSGARRDLQLK